MLDVIIIALYQQNQLETYDWEVISFWCEKHVFATLNRLKVLQIVEQYNFFFTVK